MNVDIEKIRILADLAIEKNLSELTVEDGDKSVTIKLPSSQVISAPQISAPPQMAISPVQQASKGDAPTAEKSDDERYLKVTAPMVGTFYASPSPESPPFVTVGAAITKGQTLCIIEAMKMMNDLESDVSGKVIKILAENGKPVEFGQVIMLVDPNA